MKYLLLIVSSLSLIFYIFVSIQESGRLQDSLSRSQDKLDALELFHVTRLAAGTSQLISLERINLCDSFETTPTRVSLFEDQKVKVFVSERPDMSFDHVKPFEIGKYSIRDGAVWLTTLQKTSGLKRKRTFPILELSENKSLSSINLESEVTKENCL